MFRSFTPIALVLTSVCFAQGPGKTEHTATLSGAQTWTDTGIDLAAGDSLTLTAETKPGSAAGCSPGGAADVSRDNDHIPLPSASAGELIAKTSDRATPVAVGKQATISATELGHLFLGVNEDAPSKCDFTVKVEVTHGAGTATAPTGMRDKLSSAAQVFMKSQFGGKDSGQSQSNSAVGNGAAAANAPPAASAGLKLPSMI